jgi:5-aminopentanamidase
MCGGSSSRRRRRLGALWTTGPGRAPASLTKYHGAMKTMPSPDAQRVALAQVCPMDGDKERNLGAAGAAVAAAAQAGAAVVVLPEYALTGFPADRMRELAEPLDGPALSAFREMAVRNGVCLVAGLPRLGAVGEPAPIFDTTVVISPDGELLTVYDKTHLFDRERGVFTPGAALQDPFVYRDIRFGVLCCFDIEFPEPARVLALRGAQCLLVPSANMKPWGPSHRAFVRARAIENHCWVAYANAVGSASGYEFEGQSCLVDPLGRLRCDAGRQETVVWGDVDVALADEARAVGDYLTQRRPELYG